MATDVPDGAIFVERYELAIFNVRTLAGIVGAPVVDGWIEVQLALLRIPDGAERRDYFAALGSLVAVLCRHTPGLRWYFLHKAPGLKLRFRLGMPHVRLVEELIGTIEGWRLPWLQPSGLGSVFDQAELMPRMFRDDAARLLSLAADVLVAAAGREQYCAHEDWAVFLIRLLDGLDLDAWLAHGALSRLRRLRTVPLQEDEAGEVEPLLDPSALLTQASGPFAPGFSASVSLLQTLNLMFNMWGVDAPAQRRILDLACAATRPQLMESSDG